MLPRLLFMTHRLPYPPDRGDKIRTFHVLKALTEHFEVHLASVTAPSERSPAGPLDAMCASVHRFAERGSLAVNGIGALVRGTSVSEARFGPPGMRGGLRRLIGRFDIDVTLSSSSAVAPWLMGVPGRHYVDIMDVDSDKWRQYAERSRNPAARWIYRRESRLVSRLEAQAVQCANGVFVTAEREKDLLLARHPGTANVRVAGNGVDIERFAPMPYEDRPPEVVFVGAMDYWPNVDAVTWFAQAAWPQVRAVHPQARFLVVGADPDRRVRALRAVPGCQVTGAVERVEPYLERARIVVVPVRVARGIQNKVLEGMAAGLPVVTTPQGADGIDAVHGETLYVCEDAPAMARIVGDLLSDPDRAQSVGERARALMQTSFSWPRQLEPMVSMIAGLPGPDHEESGTVSA